jgi:hypothetical protein
VGLGAVHTRHDPHPLGNNDSFQGSVYASYVMTFSSPKVSDLSRHERGLVPAYLLLCDFSGKMCRLARV